MARRAKWRQLLTILREGKNLTLYVEGRLPVEVEDKQVIWEFREDMDVPYVFIKRKTNRFGPIVYVKVSGPKKRIMEILPGIGVTLP